MINWLLICIAIVRYAEQHTKEIVNREHKINIYDVLAGYRNNFGKLPSQFGEDLYRYLSAYVEARRATFTEAFINGNHKCSEELMDDFKFRFDHNGLECLTGSCDTLASLKAKLLTEAYRSKMAKEKEDKKEDKKDNSKAKSSKEVNPLDNVFTRTIPPLKDVESYGIPGRYKSMDFEVSSHTTNINREEEAHWNELGPPEAVLKLKGKIKTKKENPDNGQPEKGS